jgi:hypothetical protein
MPTRIPRLRKIVALGLACSAGIMACSKDSSHPRDVTGVVRYRDASPAGGALVGLHFRAPVTGGSFHRATFAEGDGSFVLRDVAAGSYIVSAYDFVSELVAGAPLQVRPGGVTGETTFVALTLDSAGTFTGTVTLEGQLLHGDIEVRVQGLPVGDLTDTLGRYGVPGLPPGGWTLVATRHGYLPGSAVDTIPTPGDSVEVAEFELRRE